MLEPVVFSALPPPADALALLAAAGAGDAGVLIDTLHLARAGGGPGALDARGEARLPYVRRGDAASPEPAGTDPSGLRSAVEEAVSNRLPPGERVLPLSEVLRR